MSEEIKPAALLLTVSALLSREREREREGGGWGRDLHNYKRKHFALLISGSALSSKSSSHNSIITNVRSARPVVSARPMALWCLPALWLCGAERGQHDDGSPRSVADVSRHQ